MKKAVCFFALAILSGAIFAQTPPATPRVLLGSFSRDSLLNEPFKTWFEAGYNAYVPQPEVVEQLKKINLKAHSVQVFMGTWCGDTKRELPRFLKTLDAIGFPKQNVEIIGVSNLDDTYKQSPNHEERGLEIYRVATFVWYKNGVEVNRIVEYPVISLETDLLAILSGAPYTPNYKTYPFIRQWQKDGTLVSDNTSPKGLANQLRPLRLHTWRTECLWLRAALPRRGKSGGQNFPREYHPVLRQPGCAIVFSRGFSCAGGRGRRHRCD